MPRYYHVTFITPVGPGNAFHRCPRHSFFHPEEYDAFVTGVARSASLASKVLVSPQHVVPTDVTELDHDAAVARWPNDFLPTE